MLQQGIREGSASHMGLTTTSETSCINVGNSDALPEASGPDTKMLVGKKLPCQRRAAASTLRPPAASPSLSTRVFEHLTQLAAMQRATTKCAPGHSLHFHSALPCFLHTRWPAHRLSFIGAAGLVTCCSLFSPPQGAMHSKWGAAMMRPFSTAPLPSNMKQQPTASPPFVMPLP